MGSFVTAGCSSPSEPCRNDAVRVAALDGLDTFADWTSRHHVSGVVGEVGWPAGSDWASVAQAWGEKAKQAHLPAYVWAAAPWWSEGDPLAFYRGKAPSPDVTEDSEQARTFEGLMRGGLAGGVGLAEGSFGAALDDPKYSTAHPGVYGKDYTYPSRNTLRYLKSRGITKVRLAVMWERLQPRLKKDLRASEVKRVAAVLRDAHAEGLQVNLDLHNYGRYATEIKGRRTVLTLGSSQLPASALIDVWQRLTKAFKGQPALTSLGLMNEPHDLPGGATTWKSASRGVLTAIRKINRTIPVWVAGYQWAAASSFTGDPWIPKNLGPVAYEAHQYFDADHSGTYKADYAGTQKALRANGVASCSAS